MSAKLTHGRAPLIGVLATLLGLLAAAGAAADEQPAFIPRLVNTSTVPSNGDVNPYGPLALRFAPNGHLLAANGDAVNAAVTEPSEIVEFTRQGEFVRQYNVDSSQGGAFGIDTVAESEPGEFNYAVIDDVTNSLAVYRLRPH
jgi:hypothetical protein